MIENKKKIKIKKQNKKKHKANKSVYHEMQKN